MTFRAKTQSTVLFVLLLLFILLMTLNKATGLLYILIPATVIILVTMFINFKFEILADHLIFEVCILSLSIYSRTVSSQDINEMKFTRVGWSRKCVVVKNRKGFNFKLSNFSPETLHNELIVFANKYDIPISKSKDYKRLEK